MPGPAPEPYQLKLLKSSRPGYDSGGRPLKVPPAFRRIAPKPPAGLGRTAAAHWRRIVPGLQRLDLLKEEDQGALAIMCETWETFVKATKDVRVNGQTQTLPTGRKLANPSVGIAHAAAREYRAYAAQFGLTPAAELALGVKDDGAADDEDNPFAGPRS